MSSAHLFDTIPQDALLFGRGPAFQPKLVADWLGLDKGELSRIASVSRSSVRYDAAAPRALIERLEEIANIANMVAQIFDDDGAKTALWFRTKNPMLGDVSPRDMVRLGRHDRLRKFIVRAVADQSTRPTA